jgi:hypothetical protein
MLITSNLVFSDWERIFKEPMATAAAIDRLVDHAAILEFNVPSYRTRKRPAQRHRRRRRKCSRERRLRARRDGDARDPQRVPSITVAPYEGVKERRNRLNINLVATGKNSCHRTEEIVDAEHLQVWAGVDASVKPDSTAIVCATCASSRPTILHRRRPVATQSSAHRFLHERADPCLFGGGQLF